MGMSEGLLSSVSCSRPAPPEPRSPGDGGAYDTDEALIEGLLSRDERAWRVLHARYGRLVFRCIHSVLRRASKHVGSDAAREVYANFLLALHERDMHKLRVFDPDKGRAFSSWLGRLATNCAIDYVRKVRPWTSIDDVAGLEPAPTPDAHRLLVARRRLDVVRDAARGLSARDRELLALAFHEALEPDAIAARMGVSVKTVYSKSHKIREKLRSALTDAQLAA